MTERESLTHALHCGVHFGMSDSPRLRVDFNRADENDVVWAFRERASNPDGLDKGQYLVAYDYEGNECLARVVEFDGRKVLVQLELSTWVDANPLRIVVEDVSSLEGALLAGVRDFVIQSRDDEINTETSDKREAHLV